MELEPEPESALGTLAESYQRKVLTFLPARQFLTLAAHQNLRGALHSTGA